MKYIVRIEWTTDENNEHIPHGEPLAQTYHGTFDSEEAARSFIYEYPEDTDIDDFYLIPLNAPGDSDD